METRTLRTCGVWGRRWERRWGEEEEERKRVVRWCPRGKVRTMVGRWKA